MTLYRIVVSGCDDQTALDIELTADQFAIVDSVARLITAKSTYGCEPTMTVKELSDD